MRLKHVLPFFRISCKGSDIRAFLLFVAVISIHSTTFANTYICKNEKSVRTLRSDKTADGGCKAVYTKLGVDQVVGSSTRENGCNSILATIRQTLEGSGWKCKETKNGVVSDLSK